MLAITDYSAALIRLAIVLGSLMAACIVCLVVALWMRKWLKDPGQTPRHEGGFTLSELRQLHRAGDLTTEEFERAKEKIVAAARRTILAAPKDGSATAARPDPQPPARAGPGEDASDLPGV